MTNCTFVAPSGTTKVKVTELDEVPPFVEWAASSIPHSFWARAFYDSHKAKGASHNATIRALAFKWIRALFRCWVDRTPYNESRYLAALQKRQSPLLKVAAQAPS